MKRRMCHSRQGQSLVEYALLLAGVSLACILGVAVVGEKTADMIAAVATVLPGADADDNGPIVVGHLIEKQNGPNGISLDLNAMKNGGSRLGNNFGNGVGDGFGGLVVDPAANP